MRATLRRTAVAAAVVATVLVPGGGAPALALDCLSTDYVSAGYHHTAAIQAGGSVWTWGANFSAQLGDNTLTSKSTPVQVKYPNGQPLLNFQAVSAGLDHTLALRNDGTVWAWGGGGSGAIGDGTTSERKQPVQALISNVIAISAGDRFSLALRSDGTVWAWGLGHVGQRGDGSFTPVVASPVQVSGLPSVTAISAGTFHGLALGSDGRVYSWGGNHVGQLGDGTTTARATAGAVFGIAGAAAIAAGGNHNLAIADVTTPSFTANADSVYAWGRNDSGEIGDGTTTHKLVPVLVLSGVSQVAAGYAASYALSGTTILGWGFNGSGQLGQPMTGNRTRPQPVATVAGVTQLDGGREFAMALSARTAWGWGANSYGQLGDGTTTMRATPAHVKCPNLP